jgi:hypothetical protein
MGRGTLVRDEIMHFVLAPCDKIPRYNFVKNFLLLINPPEGYEKGIVLMLTEDGLLGLSGIRGFNRGANGIWCGAPPNLFSSIICTTSAQF